MNSRTLLNFSTFLFIFSNVSKSLPDNNQYESWWICLVFSPLAFSQFFGVQGRGGALPINFYCILHIVEEKFKDQVQFFWRGLNFPLGGQVVLPGIKLILSRIGVRPLLVRADLFWFALTYIKGSFFLGCGSYFQGMTPLESQLKVQVFTKCHLLLLDLISTILSSADLYNLFSALQPLNCCFLLSFLESYSVDVQFRSQLISGGGLYLQIQGITSPWFSLLSCAS